MSATLTVARKELRALFQSPIAIIFLGVFLVATLFLFFTQAKFFARNLADVRPLFAWLPVLLIFLVSAVTMRSWAEERKAGTLEVLLTLPVRTIDLVLGKFLAGMGLVALALLFTAPLPITVSLLGPLDWGPVIGGYFAALLLASAYMAIGLCVSARTDNQVVALMVTLVLGGLLWLVGTDTVASFFSAGVAETLRALGTGSRFESVERGVLDVRDIVYYGTITAFFLVLNGVFLDRERLDPHSSTGRSRNLALLALVGLVGANAVALNLWLAPFHRARADLTAGRDYSISDVTTGVLANLDEPLRIRALISEKTHPVLAPLVPQIRDTLSEYEIFGDGNVIVEMADPNGDEELEAEIQEQFGVKPIPFGVSDSHSQSVVNAYFHIVIQYGDQYEVLEFRDIIEVHTGPDGMQVKLRNLEYDLTRSIRKVSQEFQTVESLIAKLPTAAKVTAYITPSMLPEDFVETADALRTVGQELEKQGAGRLTFAEVDPTGNEDLQHQLFDELGIQALAADLFATKRFYLHLVSEVGENAEAILPRGDLTGADIRAAVEAALRRATPGQLKKVALFTEQPVSLPNPNLPPNMQPPPPEPDFRYLEQILGQNFEIERTQLEAGVVSQDVDVLIVGKPGAMTAKQQFAIDQYLMRGGALIVMGGAYRVEANRSGLSAAPSDKTLFDLLETWGVEIDPSLVMDPNNVPFPVPTTRTLPGGLKVQDLALIPYPFFPDVRGAALNPDHAALAGLTSLVMPWSSPVSTAADLPDRQVDWLLKSTDEAWLRPGGSLEPDSVTQADGPTWNVGADPAAFPSFFADLPSPLASADGGDPGEPLKGSVAEGRLLVLGSSEVVSDLMLDIASTTNNDAVQGNLQLIQNALDWSVEDTDLLAIRTAGAFARTLMPLEDSESRAIEIRTWLMVLFPVLIVLIVPRLRRRNATAIPLSPATEQP